MKKVAMLFLKKYKTIVIWWIKTLENWFVKGDGHWNCLGHKNVSNLIVERLNNIYAN